MKTNNSFAPIGPNFGFITSPALRSVNDFAFGSVTIITPGTIIYRIVFIIINSKTTFFYSKQLTAKDYNIFKFYIKKIIWIIEILFVTTVNICNYILGIWNKIH